MNAHEILRWRYATKKFATSKDLPTEDLDSILEAKNLAAASYGLQPFDIVVMTNAKKQASTDGSSLLQRTALYLYSALGLM
jgi:nitroreductase